MSAAVLARTDAGSQPDPAGSHQLPQPGPRPDRPARIGESLLAAAAVLGGSTSLTALLRGSGWIPPLLEVVAVIWLVGVGGRLTRAPVVLVPVLQLVGFAVALTSLFTTTGIGGVLPDASVVAEARVLLAGAWQQILTTASPSPSTPQLSFLIALAVGGVALLSDVLVSQFRSPAMTALPLLSLYSVPASISGASLPWFSFAAPAALYALLLAVSGHHTRPAECEGRAGFTLRVGAIAALATMVALLVSGTLPGIGTKGWLPAAKSKHATGVGLSLFASLRGNLTNSTPTPLFTVTGQLAADYFSTATLTTWTPNQGWSLGNLNADISNIAGPLGPAPTTGTRVQVDPLNYRDRFLPILTGTSEINGLASNWNFDTALHTVFRTDTITPNPYTLQVNHSPPTVAQLQQDIAVVNTGLTGFGALPASVRDLARQITAADTGTFDKARTLQQWFTNPAHGFRYSLDVPAGDSGDALVDFLTQKQGFCQQYATAMAIMLRTLNIPSRVVIGFTQGALQADGSYLISSRNAHAWVEVPFQRTGWVRFDPTPAVGGQGGQQGYTSSAPGTTPPATPVAPTTAARTAPQPAPPPAPAPPTVQSDWGTAAPATAPGPPDTVSTVLLTSLIGAAVAVALALLPRRRRLRRRRRRLRLIKNHTPGSAEIAWTEIEDTAVDHGMMTPAGESIRVTAHRIGRRAQLSPGEQDLLRQVVLATEKQWFGPGPAPDVTESAEAQVALVAAVITGLGRHAPLPLPHRILPPSQRKPRAASSPTAGPQQRSPSMAAASPSLAFAEGAPHPEADGRAG